MWNKPIKINETTDGILLDTEGLGSTERSTNTDIKIFSLAILLSSLFIYNSIGTINEQALEDLSLVCNLTEQIHINQGKIETGIEFRSFFPGFLWVLRDFFHDLEGQTPREYLETCLRVQPGHSESIFQKNKIREAIAKYFVDRDCLTLLRPIQDETRLAHIEDEEFEDLRPEFKEGVNDFVERVFAKSKQKIVAGKALNGTMLLGLAMEYVGQMNDNETPTVMTSLDRVVSQESRRIMDDMNTDYVQKLDLIT